MDVVVVPPGEGKRIEVMGAKVTIRLPSERAGGAIGMIEFEAPPGFRAPPMLHMHRDIDWHAYVQSGTIAMGLTGGRSVTIPAGGLVFVPRLVAFRWWNASESEPARWLIGYTPGGFERYFDDVAASIAALGRPPVPADVASAVPQLWAKHGIEPVHG